MHSIHRRIILLCALVILIVALLEVYAHTYMQLHITSVISENDARDSFPFGSNTGTYSFSDSGCIWLVIWRANEASPSVNYGYICIYKVEQNRSLLVLNTDLVVLRLETTSNNTVWFSAGLDETLYENNRTTVRIRYNFGEIGTYPIDFGLVVQVYEETLLAILPRGEIRIPLETTIYYGP